MRKFRTKLSDKNRAGQFSGLLSNSNKELSRCTECKDLTNGVMGEVRPLYIPSTKCVGLFFVKWL